MILRVLILQTELYFITILPDNLKTKELSLEIKDEDGNVVRTISSRANP